ncbi:MAG: hypothetical protein V4454_12235 [Pseudomonadota bacterium]
MGAFFGDGLDLAAGFDGALLACGLVDMAGFLTFSTAFAIGFPTGFDCLAVGFTAGFAAFWATGAALTGLAAGFLDFCKGMEMSPLAKNLSVSTRQALMI